MDSLTSARESCRIRARNSNVNERTLLATDYLNHFNEALMLAEMLVDMPEMQEGFLDWRPLSYVEHFEQSGIADRALVIEAYPLSPAEYRASFDQTVAALHAGIEMLQGTVRESVANGMTPAVEMEIAEGCGHVRRLIDRASSIINGTILPPLGESVQEPVDAPLGQDAINALFD